MLSLLRLAIALALRQATAALAKRPAQRDTHGPPQTALC
jgi:hypothetical protein